MPDRTADVTRIVHGGRARGLSDDQIRALVARYDERQTSAPEPQAPAGASSATSSTGSDVLGGLRSSAANVMFQGGDLIRRGLGMERVIDRPAVQAAITAPESAAGRTGRFVGDAAQFLVPGIRVAKATRALPWFNRTMAEAGTAAGVAGVQTGGDPASIVTAAGGGVAVPALLRAGGATAQAARRTAAGAREGGLGGAMAATIRATGPIEPRRMLVQALKPRNTRVNFESSLDRALPELKAAEAALGRPIATVDDLVDATKLAKQQVRAQLDAMAGPMRQARFQVDLSGVADAVESSIPKKLQLKDPARALRMREEAAVYRKPFDLEDAENLLIETNAELDSFYAKHPGGQRAALKSSPEIAATEAEARALRDVIYRRLDEAGNGDGARELQRRYGALMEVHEEAGRRALVAKRQQPVSLAEQIAEAGGMADRAAGVFRVGRGIVTASPSDVISGGADMIRGQVRRETARYLKEQQTTDALIRRAFAAYKGRPAPVPMPSHRPVRGYLPPGARPMPAPPDPSFVRGVPAMRHQSGQRALPPPRSRPMPAHDVSGGGSVPARRTVQRNPRTGRMQRIYTSEAQ